MSTTEQKSNSSQSKSGEGRRRGRGRRSRGGGGGGGRNSRPDLVLPPTSEASRERLQLALESGQFIVFVIRTTGSNPEKNGITEIFAIRWKDGEVKDTFYSMVNPGIPIPPIVRRMTGIDNKMVRNAPRIDEVMPDIVKFIGDDVLV